MGWAGWNRFFCDYNEATIREQSDALVSTGMRELGYRYVLIQECIAPGRQSDGTLLVDPVRFPQGMKPLIDYIHSRGLKAGVYTDVGVHTCFGPPYYQGSFGHEDADAATFAAWGFDLIEMDYCDRQSGVTGREVYERMAQSIAEKHGLRRGCEAPTQESLVVCRDHLSESSPQTLQKTGLSRG